MKDSTITLDALIAASLDAVIVTDLDGRILAWNRLAEQIFGWTTEEAIGRTVAETIIPPEMRAPHTKGMDRHKSTSSVKFLGQRLEREAVRKDGTRLLIELSMSRPHSAGPGVFLVFIRDLTSQREAHQQLEELQSRLLHVSRVSAMGTMAATLSHELNQPLTAAKSYLAAVSRLLERDDAPSRDLLNEGVSGAKEAINHASETIRSVRQMADKRVPSYKQESVVQMMQDVRRILSGPLRGIHLEVSIEPEAEFVYCARVQVEQVLINLIKNAVEALDGQSSPNISFNAVRNGADVELTVTDNGVGVSDRMRPGMFAPFNSSKSTGLGMGLSICRTIVEQHGGRIWFPGEEVGTSVTFTLKGAGANPDIQEVCAA